MPKALHLFYLRKFYKENALAEGKLTLLGEQLSLKDVKIPVFMQSSREDHIAPYASVHRSATAFGGPVEFIVAGSGHIAGVINHPSLHKYQFWSARHLQDGVDVWFSNAEETQGSWWPYWDSWLRQRAGPEVPARTPGEGKLKPLADAPGEYVKVRS
jgi:polyhydroxyalkanoate synthase